MVSGLKKDGIFCYHKFFVEKKKCPEMSIKIGHLLEMETFGNIWKPNTYFHANYS